MPKDKSIKSVLLIGSGPIVIGQACEFDYSGSQASKSLQEEVPTFGICLGHQVISLSQGLKAFKMFNGHRGINHPVKNLVSGKCEVTSQNHGFAVSRDSAEGVKEVEITHIHLNDDTIAGIQLKDKPVFSVQYHPASPGPNDASYLFEQFFQLIKKSKKEKRGIEEKALQ